ncbi:MAG: hypothetical protein ACRCYO_10470 [Bacteroidia bacterium]
MIGFVRFAFWKTSFVAFLFSISAFAQRIPDSVLVRQLAIKKITVLRLMQDSLTDTVWVWNSQQHFPIKEKSFYDFGSSDTSHYAKTYDSSGRLICCLRKQKEHCYFDSVGFRNWYNEQGQLIQRRVYSCEKGSLTTCYAYNATGQVTRITCQPEALVMVSQDSFSYDALGRLIFQEGVNGTQAPPDELPSLSVIYNISYSYRKDGLIDQAIVNDDLGLNTDFEIWLAARPRPVTIFQYVYE